MLRRVAKWAMFLAFFGLPACSLVVGSYSVGDAGVEDGGQSSHGDSDVVIPTTDAGSDAGTPKDAGCDFPSGTYDVTITPKNNPVQCPLTLPTMVTLSYPPEAGTGCVPTCTGSKLTATCVGIAVVLHTTFGVVLGTASAKVDSVACSYGVVASASK